MCKAWLLGMTMLVAAGPAWAQGQRQEDLEARARQRISTMEAVLERAVAAGANSVQRQFREVLGESPTFIGMPQVRGHRLDGLGVLFFDVGVPILRMPIIWAMRGFTTDVRTADVAIAELREIAARLPAREREAVEARVQQLELQLGVRGRAPARASALATVGSPAVAAEARPPVAPARVADDPNDAYTREVTASIVDAMIEHSGALDIAPGDWLVVAARDNMPRDPLVPGDLADFSTVQFRIRGSDLSAYRAGRLTLDETRARVQVSEY